MQPMGQSRCWHHRHRTMAMQSCGIRSSMYAYHSLVTYGSSMDLSFHGASENSVMRTAYRLESLDGHCNNPVDNTKADRGDFVTFEGKKNSYARATPTARVRELYDTRCSIGCREMHCLFRWLPVLPKSPRSSPP